MADTATKPARKPRKPTVKATAAAKPAKAPAAKAPATRRAKAKPAETAVAKSRFARAMDEARAGVDALKGEAKARSSVVRGKLADRQGDLLGDAKALQAKARQQASQLSGQAKVKAGELAKDGKQGASDALSGLGKLVADNASTIDENLGARYGDYARTAARHIQETAAKLEAKELAELGDDAKAFIRNKPGLALGIAAVAGFALAALFRGRSDED